MSSSISSRSFLEFLNELTSELKEDRGLSLSEYVFVPGTFASSSSSCAEAVAEKTESSVVLDVAMLCQGYVVVRSVSLPLYGRVCCEQSYVRTAASQHSQPSLVMHLRA